MPIVWQRDMTVPQDDRDGICGVKYEDGGQAAIMYHPDDDTPPSVGDDGHFFVRLHSWDETELAIPDGYKGRIAHHPEQAKRHHLFRSLLGKRVRVTIETLD